MERMKDYAKGFYKSKTWQHCRDTYLRKVGGLCERCLAKGLVTPAVIVHHKVYITPERIKDPKITLSFENLEALCRDCHGAEHSVTEKRYKVDELGRVAIAPDP